MALRYLAAHLSPNLIFTGEKSVKFGLDLILVAKAAKRSSKSEI